MEGIKNPPMRGLNGIGTAWRILLKYLGDESIAVPIPQVHYFTV